MIRPSLDDKQFQEFAWMSLTELHDGKLPNAANHLGGILTEEDCRSLSERPAQPQDMSTVFFGPDIRTGLALSLIADCRSYLSEQG